MPRIHCSGPSAAQSSSSANCRPCVTVQHYCLSADNLQQFIFPSANHSRTQPLRWQVCHGPLTYRIQSPKDLKENDKSAKIPLFFVKQIRFSPLLRTVHALSLASSQNCAIGQRTCSQPPRMKNQLSQRLDEIRRHRPIYTARFDSALIWNTPYVTPLLCKLRHSTFT